MWSQGRVTQGRRMLDGRVGRGRPLGPKWERGRNLKEDRLKFIFRSGFWAYMV